MRIIIVIILGLIISGCISNHPKNYSKNITATNILRIDIGMNKTEVIHLLGNPVKKEPLTFQYTEERTCNYPMVWIHFDSLGVREVYVKYYELFDERGVYGLSREKEKKEPYRWGEEALRDLFKDT